MKLFVILLFFFTNLFSSENIAHLISSINNEIKKYDRLATKTKANEHYQPYIVSVLKNSTLIKLGCNTLLDALKLIPSLDITSDNLNYKSVIFRGSNPVSFGQSKLFIDGILVNNILFDGYSEYLDMPIELIKRIEVIRGPGNKGDNIPSYAGSIHIITFAEDMKQNSIFSKIGDNNYRVLGFIKSYQTSNLKIFTDFYYKKHDNSVHIQRDGLASGMLNFPHPIDNRPLSTPADVPLYLRNYSLGIRLKYKNFYIKSRFLAYKQGSAFGLNNVPSQEDNYFKLPNHYLTFGYKKTYDNKTINTKIGYNYNALDTKSKLLPNGIKLPKLSNPMQIVTFPNGIYGENVAKQEKLFYTFNFTYQGFKKHFISTNCQISHSKTTDIVSKITDRDNGIGYVDYSNTMPFFDKNAKRTSYIFNISDKYIYNHKLQFLYSINYEKNTHIEAKIEPKLSLVYTYSNENILKLLYSKSHRTPSWQELYTVNNHSRVGNPNLKAERIETYEASYIRHFSNDNFIQSSLFYIINSNQIHNNTPNNMYVNSPNNNILYGLEVEIKSHFTPKDNFYVNFSYTDGANSPDNKLALVSKVLAKGYYIYNIKENLSLSTIIKYSSPKKRLTQDKRDDIKSSTITDLSLNCKKFHKNININLSIKNIFNTKVVYPSKPNTYQDDYPDVGRTFVISFSKRF